jgi:hypothetical protein
MSPPQPRASSNAPKRSGVSGRYFSVLKCDSLKGLSSETYGRRSPSIAHLQGSREGAMHRAADIVVIDHSVPQPMRHRQHPLAHRRDRQHTLDHVLGKTRHALSAARRTEAASF